MTSVDLPIAMSFKAVIFDMGGVLYRFKDYKAFSSVLLQARSDPQLRSKLESWEKGHIATSDIKDIAATAFGSQSLDHVDFEKLNFDEIMGSKNDRIWKAIDKIKESGIKVALLTNNGWWSEQKVRTTVCEDQLGVFDVVVESCRVGTRKPEPEIYQTVISQLGVQPHECIFVDDLKNNVEGATKLGIHGIHMVNQDEEVAAQALSKALGLQL